MPFTDPSARKRYIAKWYRKNREKLLKYAKEYREANAESVAETKRRIHQERYKNEPAYREGMLAYGKRRRRSDPERVKAIEKRSRQKHADRLREANRKQSGTPKRLARQAVARAIRRGDLPKASTLPCHCGKPATEYHHHKGYARQQWLEVQPICAQCHKDHHFTSHST